jgi:hypothetical protein
VFTRFTESKNQRAGCVGIVFLVVKLEIQAFGQDVKFKLFMPYIRSRYLQQWLVTITIWTLQTNQLAASNAGRAA